MRGIGPGERLSIIWPGAQVRSGYIAEHTCDPLALLAALFPDRMLTLVMGEVEWMANDPLPVAQRPPRIAALERELDELRKCWSPPRSWPASPSTARPRRRRRRCWASGWWIRSGAPRDQRRCGHRPQVAGGIGMTIVPRRMSAAGRRRHPGAAEVVRF